MLLFAVLGVYSLGCYLTYPRRPILNYALNSPTPTIKGSDAIQQCINRANKINNRNFQGIGITRTSLGYKCAADVQADRRYNTYGNTTCDSDGLGASNTNGTAVFMFTGDYQLEEEDYYL